MKRTTVPGTVIHHVAATTSCYVGCPSIVVLPSGTYVASHSHFGNGATNSDSFVYRSDDRGTSWEPIAEIHGQIWSKPMKSGPSAVTTSIPPANRRPSDARIQPGLQSVRPAEDRFEARGKLRPGVFQAAESPSSPSRSILRSTRDRRSPDCMLWLPQSSTRNP